MFRGAAIMIVEVVWPVISGAYLCCQAQHFEQGISGHWPVTANRSGQQAAVHSDRLAIHLAGRVAGQSA
jgi:hypothetical protein